MRTMPSEIEYSLCRRRWTKRGEDMRGFYACCARVALSSGRTTVARYTRAPDETQPIAHPQRPRPALPRAHLGRFRSPAAVAAARLDGRLGVVPVPGRCARSATGTCIAPDWRGFGLSEWAASGYWFPDYLRRPRGAAAVTRAPAPVDLVGHSMGGNIAEPLRRHAPGARARKLALLEGFGLPRTVPSAGARRLREMARARSPTRRPSSPTPRSKKSRNG